MRSNLSLEVIATAFIAVALVTNPPPSAAQQEKVLHSFVGTDGATPQSVLTFDAAGNLYGEASAGGANGEGTVFELTRKAGGIWAAKVLHTFGNGTDGALSRLAA